MTTGEPDFPTAKPICEAGMRVIETGNLFYTPALGLPELREAIARFYKERYDVTVPASRIIITSGASGASTSGSGRRSWRTCASSVGASGTSAIWSIVAVRSRWTEPNRRRRACLRPSPIPGNSSRMLSEIFFSRSCAL